MIKEIIYVSSNREKFNEISNFLRDHYPTIIPTMNPLDLDELQTLNEEEVLCHKAQQAWSCLKKPLLVDDAGAYLHAYPSFPGTLAKPIMNTLGVEGFTKLTESNNKVEFFVGLAYINNKDSINYFRGSTQGYFIPYVNPHLPNFYQHFKPEDQNLPIVWPRQKAIALFAKWLTI